MDDKQISNKDIPTPEATDTALLDWETTLTPDQRAEILKKRTQAVAAPPLDETQDQTLDILTFLLGEETYGLEVPFSREIYPLPRITPVPRTPDFIVGLFSARGQLISIVDLYQFLGLPKLTVTETSKIILVSNDRLEIGLLVNEVIDTVKIFRNELEAPLAIQNSQQADFILGITETMVVIFNMNILLDNKRLIIDQT